MINPNISLAVETPQVADPLKTAAEGLSVRGMRQQQESGALSLEQQRQDLADSQVIRQLYGKHKGDLEAVTKEAAGQVSPKSILALQKATIDHKEAMAKLDETQLKNLETHNKLAANESGGILAAPPEARAAMYPAAVQRMVQSGAVKPGELPEQYPGDEAVQNFFDTHAGYQHVFDREKETRAATLATNKDRREAAVEDRASMMAPAQRAKLEADAQIASDTAAGKKPIQPEEQARIDLQARSQEEVLRHNAQTEKNATSLLKVAQGNLGVSQEHAAIAKQVYEQTYGAGANPALVGVLPAQRNQVSAAAQKAADEFVNATEAAANMKTMIDLARSGNKVAYAYAPTTGVLTINTAAGVKRVNMAEISSYGGAGSSADNIKGWLGKHLTGASIDADVLKDMETLHSAIAGNAGEKYNANLASINQNYHSNFQPVKGVRSPGEQKVTTQAQYDALPSGTTYTGEDGKKYKKP